MYVDAYASGDDYVPKTKFNYSIDDGNIFKYAYEMSVSLHNNPKNGDLTTIDNR